jgi:hypothetical protein
MNRGIEIDSQVADHVERSLITRQVESGVAIRMACLEVLTRRARALPGWPPLGQTTGGEIMTPSRLSSPTGASCCLGRAGPGRPAL